MDGVTKLNKNDEKKFRDWYNQVSKYLGLDPNPDAEGHYYDYRGYWKNGDPEIMLSGEDDAHFPDTYKLPGYPTFSTESIYSREDTLGGEWSRDESGSWYFTASPYTADYADRTIDYLKGTGENYILHGDTIRSFADGGAFGIPYRQDYQSESDNYDFVYSRLLDKGVSPVQAIGILANLEVESGGLKNVNIENQIGAYGVQQWLGPRKQELFRRYGNLPSLENQIDFLVDEHKGNVRGGGWNFTNKGKRPEKKGFEYYMYSRAEFENAPTVEDATIAWNQGFGRPKKFELNTERRINAARRLSKRFGVEDTSQRVYDVEGYYNPSEPAVLVDNNISKEVSDENMRRLVAEVLPRDFLPQVSIPYGGIQTNDYVAQNRTALNNTEPESVPVASSTNRQASNDRIDNRDIILQLIKGIQLDIKPL